MNVPFSEIEVGAFFRSPGDGPGEFMKTNEAKAIVVRTGFFYGDPLVMGQKMGVAPEIEVCKLPE